MSMTARPIVVKLGGSLLGWQGLPGALGSYLDGLKPAKAVLIVGGGKAADFLRELDSVHGIGEKRSHGLALRMLDVTAHLVAAVVPGVEVAEGTEELERVWNRGFVPALAPRRLLEDLDRDREKVDLRPECWDVTSDSIAALAAVWIGASSLKLLKSTGFRGRCGRAEASRRGLVDPYFPTASRTLDRVTVINLRADPPTTEELDAD